MEHNLLIVSLKLVLPKLLSFRIFDKRVLLCLALSNHSIRNDDILESIFLPNIIIL